MRLDVSRQAVNAPETGTYAPSLPPAFKIARLLELRIEDIFLPDRRVAGRIINKMEARMTFPAERSVCRETRAADAHEQLLYFTSSSLWADDRQLVFLSDREGHPNIYRLDRESGAVTKLSRNTEGFLKSYVYFDGAPYRGLGKASVSLDPASGMVYYLQGRGRPARERAGAGRTAARAGDRL